MKTKKKRPVPRISTRGYYDLSNGKTLKNNSYHTYPKNDFKKLINSKEFTVMIHGLRNDNAGAVARMMNVIDPLNFRVFLQGDAD